MLFNSKSTFRHGLLFYMSHFNEHLSNRCKNSYDDHVRMSVDDVIRTLIHVRKA